MAHMVTYFVNWNENGQRKSVELCSMKEAMSYINDVLYKRETVTRIQIVEHAIN